MAGRFAESQPILTTSITPTEVTQNGSVRGRLHEIQVRHEWNQRQARERNARTKSKFRPEFPTTNKRKEVQKPSRKLEQATNHRQAEPLVAARVQAPACRWSEASHHAKHRAAIWAIAATGGQAFSLDLAPNIVEKCYSKGTDWFHRRLTRYLRDALGRHVLIAAFWHSKEGRLHLHGAIVFSRDEEPKVRAAMKTAGGRWAAKRGSDHQIKLKGIWDADGWARYCARGQRKLRDQIVGPLVFRSHEASRATKALYESQRAPRRRSSFSDRLESSD
jgi:hypothetical protein